MQINLAMPYSPTATGTRELAFYSKHSDDLLFRQGDTIEICCHVAARSVGMTYTLSRNFFRTQFIQGAAQPTPGRAFVIRIPTARLYPGFYDIRVCADVGVSPPIEGLCTIGWRIEQMKIRDTRPADFAAFWNQRKAELAKIPLKPQEGTFKTFKGKEIDSYNLASAALPGDYDPLGHKTDQVESAKVSFSSVQGNRVYGWLAKPAGKGPFPAMLVLPGAGFAARPMPLEHARHGYVALDIQVHGQDVDQKEYPPIPGHNDNHVYQPVEAYYYSRVYLNALQAVSYLASRPDVDPKRIVVVGGSQGGRLSVVAAALDHRIAAAVPAIAHNANLVYLQWATQCNLTSLDGMDQEIPPPPADTPEQKCQPYYDVMNFAPDIQCPVLMNAGLIDQTSLPTGVFATHQRLGSRDKTLVPLPGLAHDWSPEFDRRAWRWLEEKLQ